MKNKNKKIIMMLIAVFLLTGCTKILKDDENKVVTNKETGQSVTENIICRPTDKEMLKIYQENDIKIEKLPECDKFSPLKNYEGLWTSFFVKPLAWFILKIKEIVNSSGLAIIIACLLIRCVMIPLTKKTAMQSENMKKAQPEVDKLEKKYANKTSQEDQTRKAQELMIIYQKYQINPVSGCILAVIQLPLLFAFLEAINRTPAIFESKFLVFQMGTTVTKGIANGNYWYVLLLVLILGTTYFSFRKTMKDQSISGSAQGNQMKFSMYFMLAMIAIASFSLPTALGLYWIASSGFTIIQNLWVERKNNKK